MKKKIFLFVFNYLEILRILGTGFFFLIGKYPPLSPKYIWTTTYRTSNIYSYYSGKWDLIIIIYAIENQTAIRFNKEPNNFAIFFLIRNRNFKATYLLCFYEGETPGKS